MGIFMLTSYVLNEKPTEASSEVSLTDFARRRREELRDPDFRAVVVVDGSALVHLLTEEVADRSLRGWEWAIGGEHQALHAGVLSWVSKLRAGGVEPVVCFDPPKGVDETGERRKSGEAKRRMQQRFERIGRTMMMLGSGKEALSNWESREGRRRLWSMPALSQWQAQQSLRHAGVDCVTFEVEADDEIVRECARRDAFAVLGSDSDFFALAGAKYIPFGSLQVTDQGSETAITARLYTSEQVAQALGIPAERLHELAALCGNDITSECMETYKLPSLLGIPLANLDAAKDDRGAERCLPKDVAAFLSKLPPTTKLVDHEAVASIMAKDKQFARALADNYEFYTGRDFATGLPRQDPAPCAGSSADTGLHALLVERVRRCEMPGWALAVHRTGRLVTPTFVELMTEAMSPVAASGRPLRAAMYALVHRAGPYVTEVVRMGDTPWQVPVPVASEDEVREVLGDSDLCVLRGRTAEAQQGPFFRFAARFGGFQALEGSERVHAWWQGPEGDGTSAARPLGEGSGPEGSATGGEGGGGGLDVRGVANWLRYVAAAADPSLGVAQWDLEAAARTALLLHAGVDPLSLPDFAPGPEAAVVSSVLGECARTLHDCAQILGAAGVVPEPREILSGRLYAHVRGNTPHALRLIKGLRGGQLQSGVGAGGGVHVSGDVVHVGGAGGGVLAGEEFVRHVVDRVLESVRLEAPEAHKGASAEHSAHAEHAAGGGSQEVLQGSEALPPQGELPAAGQEGSECLPIEAHRREVIERIERDDVATIHGETGCGKSTMVPVFLLQRAIEKGERVSIVIAQPRRIAAVSLAKRVAQKLGESVGGVVGYRLGMGVGQSSNQTKILFCTSGWLLMHLSQSDQAVSQYTHIILDEVHERSLDADMLSLFIKKALFDHKDGQGQVAAAKPKLVVMSATFQAKLFSEYFRRDLTEGVKTDAAVVPPIFVGAKRFPVRAIFMDDILTEYPELDKTVGWFLRREVKSMDDIAGRGRDKKRVIRDVVPLEMRKTICELVLRIAEDGNCILVFLPGLMEITKVSEALEELEPEVPLQLFVLHSLLAHEEQSLALEPAKPGHCKVILSTNIAESSVTIPDVRYVIDTGLRRETAYDERRGMQSIMVQWCSRASAKQRAGRSGRVAPGTVIRLFTKKFHDEIFLEYDEPEMLRTPLEKTLLTIRMTMPARYGTVSELLTSTLSPPPSKRVVNAIKGLFHVGALQAADEQSPVTLLGRLSVRLPVDIKLVKLILLGKTLGILPQCVVIAAALSVQDVFTLPSGLWIKDVDELIRETNRSYRSRVRFDRQSYSEPLTYLRLYKEWLTSKRDPTAAHHFSVVNNRMHHLSDLVLQLSLRVKQQLDPMQDAAMISSLDFLAQASKRKYRYGGVLYSDVSKNLGSLDAKETTLLNLAIAAACMPDILIGVPSTKEYHKNKIEGDPLSPDTTLRIKGVRPKRFMHAEILKEVLGSIGVRVTRAIIKGKGGKHALVEVRATKNLNEFEPMARDLAYDAKFLLNLGNQGWTSDVKVPVTDRILELSAIVAKEREEALEESSTPEETADIELLSSGEEDQAVVEKKSVEEEIEDDLEYITLRGISGAARVHWKLGHPDSKTSVEVYRRSALSKMSDIPSEEEGLQHRVAVAFNLLGTGDTSNVSANAVTVLPRGLFGALARVMFTVAQTDDWQVRLGWENARIVAIRVGTQKAVSVRDWNITYNDLEMINRVRNLVSASIAAVGDTARNRVLQKRRRHIAKVCEWLQEISTRPKIKGPVARQPITEGGLTGVVDDAVTQGEDPADGTLLATDDANVKEPVARQPITEGGLAAGSDDAVTQGEDPTDGTLLAMDDANVATNSRKALRKKGKAVLEDDNPKVTWLKCGMVEQRSTDLVHEYLPEIEWLPGLEELAREEKDEAPKEQEPPRPEPADASKESAGKQAAALADDLCQEGKRCILLTQAFYPDVIGFDRWHDAFLAAFDEPFPLHDSLNQASKFLRIANTLWRFDTHIQIVHKGLGSSPYAAFAPIRDLNFASEEVIQGIRTKLSQADSSCFSRKPEILDVMKMGWKEAEKESYGALLKEVKFRMQSVDVFGVPERGLRRIVTNFDATIAQKMGLSDVQDLIPIMLSEIIDLRFVDMKMKTGGVSHLQARYYLKEHLQTESGEWAGYSSGGLASQKRSAVAVQGSTATSSPSPHVSHAASPLTGMPGHSRSLVTLQASSNPGDQGCFFARSRVLPMGLGSSGMLGPGQLFAPAIVGSSITLLEWKGGGLCGGGGGVPSTVAGSVLAGGVAGPRARGGGIGPPRPGALDAVLRHSVQRLGARRVGTAIALGARGVSALLAARR